MQRSRPLRVIVLATALGAVLAGLAVGAASPSFAATVLTSTVVSTAPTPGGAAGTTSVIQLPFGGVTRSYRLFVPTSLPAGPHPLVIGLHGEGSDAGAFEALSNYDPSSGRHAVLVAYPDGLGKTWNAGSCCGTSSAANVDDVGFLAAVIADVAARSSVDKYRIAVAGFSAGGMMAYRLACSRSDLVDVVEVMSATNVAPSCSFGRPVSLLQAHGLADTLAPFADVQSGVDGVAGRDGCSGSTTAPYNSRTDVTQWVAGNCPAGTYVQLYASTSLGHAWPGAADVARYGFDMTNLTLGFNTGVWAARPAPVAYVPPAPPVSTVVTTGPAPAGVAGTTRVVQFGLDGATRQYRLFAPATLPAGPRPLQLALHSLNSDATKTEIGTTFDAGAVKVGAYVVYPDGLANSWNAGTCCGPSVVNRVDDVKFLVAVIADVGRRVSVDRNRIAMEGGSTGGMMAYRFACERSDLVNIYEVLGGAFVMPSCTISRPVSVMHVHGQADTTVPYAGAATSPLVASGFPAASVGPTTIAQLDGCTGSSTTLYNGRSDVPLWQGTGCPAGVGVQLISPANMAHVWPTGAAEIAAAGVNLTSMTWGFSTASWALQPSPVAL
ncbi:MAG: polyhydroxybutyrate depolymerase [Frankiaceae bacterium]|nr:polyhydroxybutyrate depolymerase [Frankiaceae bacterium]